MPARNQELTLMFLEGQDTPANVTSVTDALKQAGALSVEPIFNAAADRANAALSRLYTVTHPDSVQTRMLTNIAAGFPSVEQCYSPPVRRALAAQ